MIIPEKNKKDLYDIPKNVKSRIKFTCVGDVNQVLEIALEPPPEEPDEPVAAEPGDQGSQTSETKASETQTVPDERTQDGDPADTGQGGPA